MWECPNLFELPIESKPGETKWVFWSADGYYQIGEFDGYKFTPETEVLEGYKTKLGYAAQTFAGVDDRTIHVTWYRTENDKGGFRGMMSIPTELSLVETDKGLRIAFKPVRELWECFNETETIALDGGSCKVNPDGKPVVLIIEYESGVTEVRILDHGIIECFSEGGTSYTAVEAEEHILNKELLIKGDLKDVVMKTVR